MNKWSRRLQRVREALDVSQKELAARLNVKSQSAISRWESGEKGLPRKLRDFIKAKEDELNLIEELQEEDEADVHIPEFCYGATTFRRIWKESRKRILRMSAEATISPCNPKAPGFADIEMTIRFEGVELPPDDPLYLDCLGVMPDIEWHRSRYCFDKKKGSELGWMPPKKTKTYDPADLAGTVEEVKEGQLKLGPYALGYQLKNVVSEQPIELSIIGKRGVRTTDTDAAGIPIYADCPVEFVDIAVTFVNLTPHPAPTAQRYVLRRTLVDSRPLHLAGGLRVKTVGRISKTYSFTNLRYPRPGFGLCIAWKNLK